MISLLLLLVSLLTALPLHAATRYASPSGGGGAPCTTSGTPCTLATAVSQLVDGDLLILKNGQYNTAFAPANGQGGASGNPITVRAETPGQVLIHGGGVRIPVSLTYNNDWWVIEDIDACCSSAAVVNVGSSGNTSNNNIIRWGVFWDAPGNGQNLHTVSNQYGTNNQFIQNAIFGSGRKSFAEFETTNTWLHNNFVMNTFSTERYVVVTWAYKSRSMLATNNIVTGDRQNGSQTDTTNILGVDHYSFPGYVPPTTTHELKGNLIYHFDAQNITSNVLFKSGINSTQVNSGGGHITVNSDNNLAIRRNSAVPGLGIVCGVNGPNSTCNQTHWTDSVGSLAGGTHGTNGTAIAASAAPDLLRMASATQPANGAWIRYLYDVNGNLTSTPAWPWGGAKNMSARLQARLQTLNWGTKGINGSGAKNADALVQSMTGSTFSAAAPTPVLLFTNQPQDTVTAFIIPGFEVCVYDDPVTPVKQLNWSANLSVAIQTNPAAGTLTGTTTKAPVQGCATFNNLSVDNTGIGYTLRVTSTGATQVDSTPFDILLYTPPPVSGTLILTVPR